MHKLICLIIINILFLTACKVEGPAPIIPKASVLRIINVQINYQDWVNNTVVKGISATVRPTVIIKFNDSIDVGKFIYSKVAFNNDIEGNYTASKGEDNKTLVLTANVIPQGLKEYNFTIDTGKYLGGLVYTKFTAGFITTVDLTPKFPMISNDSLLTLVQKKTFDYFWSYAHPVSGLARERLGSGETVTSGGSGFGIMAIPVAIERGFITRAQGLERMTKIVGFLQNNVDKFHGAFPHWINGTTGKVQPFSSKDDGADLMETAFLIQGLLTIQSYFKNGNSAEQELCLNIQKLWENVEWDWFRQNGEQKLYWHWSPNYNWDMNMPIAGWNEGLIVYVLAASSPTHSIPKSVYDQGWARSGAIKNGKTFYTVTLPLGDDLGGPLFFSHYSFLGLDPRHLSDFYADYWRQNTAHSQINYKYCVDNPNNYPGYGVDCWGLTASDIPTGYTASSPNNDGGTIAPTGALSSFPYTPEESMRALKFFYYTLGDKLWGEYGFKDSFNLNKLWFAPSYLAIDQGPIVIMIENYRTGLIWNLFMQNQNIKQGIIKLGFNS